MPFNGSGAFTRLYNWVSDRNANIKIRADRMDAEMDGFATGLSNCVTKDGQTTITQNIPFNNKRITGLADAAAATDAVNRQSGDARYLQLTTLQAIGLRNLVINGDFRVNQRAFAGGALGSGVYFYDRWKDIAAGSNVTVSGRVATVNSGAIAQVIEGASIKTGTHVINWSGTAACTVDGVSRAKGATFSLSAGTNCQIVFFTGTVGEVQIEFGTLPTVFEVRPYGQELVLCQRYYRRLSTLPQIVYGPISPGQLLMAYPFGQTMRATPTATVVSAPTLTGLSTFTTSATADYFYQAALATGAAGQVQIAGDGVLAYSSEL